MIKSETVNQYLNLSKAMDNMLKQLQVDFRHECKAIQNITTNLIDRFCIDYNIEKDTVLLCYIIDDPFLLHAMETDKTQHKVTCIVDFVSETYTIPDREPYKDFLNMMITAANTEIISLNKQIDILTEKSKSFWFKLFHPNIDIAISNINEARKRVEDVLSMLKKEIEYMSNGLIDQIVKTYIEEIKHTYGLMDLKLVTGDEFDARLN